jgi:phytoene desaturase
MNDATEACPVVIIGGGLGGLAAACALTARGYETVLFDQNSWLGGKAAVLEGGGFRFDMGPTILTLPSVLARIFTEAGRTLGQELDLVALDPQWRCFYGDRAVLDLVADVERMASDLEAFAPGTRSGVGYRSFLLWSRRLHEISRRHFFWRPVGGIRDLFDLGFALDRSGLSDLGHLRLGRTVAGATRGYVRDARVVQMLEHFTQYVGSAPDGSPAILCGIAHMQTSEGIWYPRGGIRAVATSLVRLATDLGVDFRLGAGVRRICLDESGSVRAIETDRGECIRTRAVVSNMDAVRTHRELLGGEPARRFESRRRYEPACSGVVLYLGLDRGYDHLLHHNFVFSADPVDEFDCIYRRGEPAPDPTCYVCAPARTDPDVAPEGGEALYVLVHTPYLRPHHDWGRMLPGYRRTILDKLARAAGLADLESRTRFESVLTPREIQERYRVLQGAIYGLASHGRFFGAFKPGNRSRDVPGLYLAGGAAHPGPGVPMVLMSGWIAADALHRDGIAARSRRNPKVVSTGEDRTANA